MALKRGFKAEANRIAVRLRRDLGLNPEDPMDLHALSKKLDVPIVPLNHFAGSQPEAAQQLRELDTSAFSAVTIPCGADAKIILHNDAHSPRRQRSDITHEFAHIVLKHPMTLPLDPTGCRLVDKDVEDEANWLGGAILISDEAAVAIVRHRLAQDAACERYGVSPDMLRFRINASGARIRVARFGR